MIVSAVLPLISMVITPGDAAIWDIRSLPSGYAGSHVAVVVCLCLAFGGHLDCS